MTSSLWSLDTILHTGGQKSRCHCSTYILEMSIQNNDGKTTPKTNSFWIVHCMFRLNHTFCSVQVNGLSNLFWGWGREDDEFYARLQDAKMTIHYPRGIKSGYDTFKHNHDKEKRPRDRQRGKNQWDVSLMIVASIDVSVFFCTWQVAAKRDRQTGITTVKYEVVSNLELTIDKAPVNFVSVKLECDYKMTPFCDSPPS